MSNLPDWAVHSWQQDEQQDGGWNLRATVPTFELTPAQRAKMAWDSGVRHRAKVREATTPPPTPIGRHKKPRPKIRVSNEVKRLHALWLKSDVAYKFEERRAETSRERRKIRRARRQAREQFEQLLAEHGIRKSWLGELGL